MIQFAGLTWDIAHDLLIDAELSHELIARRGVPDHTILWDTYRSTPQTLRFTAFLGNLSEYANYLQQVRQAAKTALTYQDQLGRAWQLTVLNARLAPAALRVDRTIWTHGIFNVLPEVITP